MSPMTDHEMAARLRERYRYSPSHELLEGADRIEALAAEVERLRELLNKEEGS